MSLEGNSRYKEVYILKEPNNYPIKIKPFDKPKKGGEGEIYRVLNSNSSLVAKIYYKDKLKPDHQKKLPILLEIAEKLRIPKRNSFQIAWCVDLVYDSPQRKKIIGFLMQFIRGERIFRAYNPQERQEYFPRFDYGHLHQIAINLAKVFQEIHKHDIVMGDVNESNFLVTNSAEVILIDIDSVQIYDRREYKYYRCTVATRGYKPPELDSYERVRKPEHDLYGLGVLIYKLLMGGMDPFPEIEGEKPSVYKHPRWALPFETLHPKVGKLMKRFLDYGYKNPQERPSAEHWVLALQEAEQSLKRCSNNERHYYQQHLQKCIWCERAWELKKDTFRRRSGYKDYNPTKTSPAETYNSSGRIYYNQGKYDLAIFEFNQAIRLNPKFAYAYNNRGIVHSDQGKYDLAIADYGKAIQLNPKYAEAYNNRGNVYYNQGKYDLALADYNQAIQLNPKDANAYYNRGLNYKENRNIEKAISDFEKAANLYKQQKNQKSHQKCLDQLKRLTKSKPLSTIYNYLSTLNSTSLIEKLNKIEKNAINKGWLSAKGELQVVLALVGMLLLGAIIRLLSFLWQFLFQ
jgi:DNA-binding helix-hairpin-helix protein with protein kinase domain